MFFIQRKFSLKPNISVRDGSFHLPVHTDNYSGNLALLKPHKVATPSALNNHDSGRKLQFIILASLLRIWTTFAMLKMSLRKVLFGTKVCTTFSPNLPSLMGPMRRMSGMESIISMNKNLLPSSMLMESTVLMKLGLFKAFKVS